MRTGATDHRGKPVSLHVWGETECDGARVHELRERVGGVLRAADESGWMSSVRARLVLLIAVSLGVGVLAACFHRDLLVLTPVVFVMGMLVLARGRLTPEAYAGAATAAYLREGCCPACAYSLAGLPAAPADGMLVCPECGSAWSEQHVGGRGLPMGVSVPRTWLELRALRAVGPAMGADARGRPVALAGPTFGGLSAERRAALGKRRVRELERALRDTGCGRWRRRTFGVALLLGAALAAGGFPIWFALAGGAQTFPGLVAFGFALLGSGYLTLLGWAVLRGYRGGDNPAYAAAFVRHGVCPACVLPLDGLPRGEDGAVECAGCGCVWRGVDDPEGCSA